MGALLVVVLAGCAASILVMRGTTPPATGLFVLAREPTAVALQGEVALWRAPALEAATVVGAVTLVPDDRLQTGAAGRAAVTWPHGATITLEPYSTLVLLPTATDGVTRVQLAGGALWLAHGDGAPPAVEVLTPEGARVAGPRFRARRDPYGRLEVVAADAPLVVAAQDSRQEVPPGGMTEVLPGRRPARPRPALVPPALAISVEGPAAWLVVDRYGRALGAPPDGAPRLTLVPGARAEAGPAGAATALLPDPHGAYQLLLWAGEAPRRYRLAAWLTDGQVLVGGPAPSEAPDALRLEGEIAAGARVALSVVVRDRTVTSGEPARMLTELPAWLRVAVAPGGPGGTAAVAGGERSAAGAVAAVPAAVGAAPAAVEAPTPDPVPAPLPTEARPEMAVPPPSVVAPAERDGAAASPATVVEPTAGPERTPGPSFGYRIAASFPQPTAAPTGVPDLPSGGTPVPAPPRRPTENGPAAPPAQAVAVSAPPMPAGAGPSRLAPMAGEGPGMALPGRGAPSPGGGVVAGGGVSGMPSTPVAPVAGTTPVPVWTAPGAPVNAGTTPAAGLAGGTARPTNGPPPGAGFLLPAAPTAIGRGGLAGSLSGTTVPLTSPSGTAPPVRRPAVGATQTARR